MTDFVAILKKTIDGQAVNTPELRQRVYARARQTIEQKLASLTPAPTQEQKARQMKALDDAIAAVETAYSPAASPSAPVSEVKLPDPLEAFISAAEAENKRAPVPVEPVMPVSVSTSAPSLAPKPAASGPLPYARDAERPELLPGPKPVAAEVRRGGNSLIWASLGVLLAVGASYGAYLKRDEIATLYASFTAPSAPEVKKVVTTSVKAPDPSAAAAKVEPAAPAAPAKIAPGEEKFTQRLTEDGKEVETGPAAAASGAGEGESVAQVTTPAAAKPAAPAAPETPAAPASVPVGQKAVFYEEKTGTQEGTVDTGAVVWSVVQDSPGADQPAEEAIRGEVNVPEKGVKLQLTIKRNSDKTLPASHIIELAFTVSEGFEGGSVEGVQRVTFKDTEQAPGNPLVGVPANFGDGFFLIALTDEKSAVENNLALMSRQSWIDIPLTYKSGRRALISIEKGIPGDKVFQDVFKAWSAKAAG